MLIDFTICIPSQTFLCTVLCRLDYQPLFGEMSPYSSPERALSSGRIKDRTRETAEIEPRFFVTGIKRIIVKFYLGLTFFTQEGHEGSLRVLDSSCP